MNNLLVMKFGGTSMGSAERIQVAAAICTEQNARRPVLAVVSAMSGVTDLLLGTLRHAEADDEAGIESSIRNLSDRHENTCRELLQDPARCDRALAGVRDLIADFRRIAHGMLMLGDRPPRSVDEAIAIGERLSALMIAEYLEASGIPARAINAREVIVTDAVFGNATPIMEATRKKASDVIEPLLASGVLPVVTGFNGATVDGRPTTLGRGGSDFSASILAAALDANELWIWTDVDGIMSADPRSVREARVLDALTYNEAAELAYNGAKVLHPRTLAPLIERQIPVWSKNSFHREHAGTRIVSTVEAPAGPRAVTSIANVALVSIEPASAAVSGTRLMARALEALADANAEVLALSSSSYRQSFCFLVRKEELAAVMKSLEADLALELTHGYLKPIAVDDNVGLLALVGEGMRGTPGLAGRLFQAISEQNVNIIAIAQGSSELTISIVVRRDGLERAIQAVHRECR
ncbi:MAG TPA: aspartate kinase [Bryobacteraceae bacterium]|jgi:aspartokinase/homoserine dehydrogenase 1|nr:aspartate kinase [Bryobacteraceae bacterium]